MNKAFYIFFLINLFLTSFYLDTWENPNSTSRVLPVFTAVQHGEFYFDRYHEHSIDKSVVNDHYYTDKAPFPTFFIMGVYGILNAVGIIDDQETYYVRPIFLLGSFLCGSLPLAIIMTLLFSVLYRKMSLFEAVCLSTLPFYGSMAFVFAGTFFSHVFSGFLLLSAYLLIERKKYLLAGLASGLCFITEYPLAIIFFCWFFLIYFKDRRVSHAVYYALGIIPSIIFIMIYNYTITGNPIVMLYSYEPDMQSNYGMSWPKPSVIYALLFSTFRGLFVYMPILILLAFQVLRNRFKIIDIKSFAFIPFVAYFMLFSSYHDWWGGWSYGPRQLLPIAMVITYIGIRNLSNWAYNKWLMAAVLLFGCIIAFMDKVTLMYNLPTIEKNPINQLIVKAFFEGPYNENNLLSMIFGITPIVASLIFGIMLVFLVATIYFAGKKWAFNNFSNKGSDV